VKSRARIGLVALYFDMFDDIMPPSFRQEKEAVGREIATMLGQLCEVDYPGIIANEAKAVEAADRWGQAGLDAIIFFPTMASPPSFSWAVARASKLPLLIWNGHLIQEIHDSFTYHDANRYSSNVGTIMVTNVFLREGRTFHLISGYYRDRNVLEQIRRYLDAVVAANRLRNARVGRIGREIQGYADVSIEEEPLRSNLGTQIVPIEKEELERAYRDVNPSRIRDHRNRLGEEYQLEVPEEILESSIRIALALEDLFVKHQLDAAAINCHSDLFRRNPEIGLVACYGASRLTGMGFPVSCTGDIPTSIAMLVLKALGGQAHYCECVMTDHVQNYILFTNTGEGDPTLARTNRKKCLICNEHYPGLRGGGASPVFSCRGGAATMVGFSPKMGAAKGHVLVAAQGEVLGTFHEDTRVANAAFRFKNHSCLEGFNRWCMAGAPHHGAFTLGDFSRQMQYVADLWGPQLILI